MKLKLEDGTRLRKIKANRTGEPDEYLWYNGYKVGFLCKIFGFYVLTYWK